MNNETICLTSETKTFVADCAPGIIVKEKTIRRFGGKLEGFESKDEQRREQKHLKAYLKGHKRFRHGFEGNGSARQPVWYPVIEILEKENIKP